MPLGYCLIDNWNLSIISQKCCVKLKRTIQSFSFKNKLINQHAISINNSFDESKKKLCLCYQARNILNGKIGIWTVKSYFLIPLYFADYLSKSDVSELLMADSLQHELHNIIPLGKITSRGRPEDASAVGRPWDVLMTSNKP